MGRSVSLVCTRLRRRKPALALASRNWTDGEGIARLVVLFSISRPAWRSGRVARNRTFSWMCLRWAGPVSTSFSSSAVIRFSSTVWGSATTREIRVSGALLHSDLSSRSHPVERLCWGRGRRHGIWAIRETARPPSQTVAPPPLCRRGSRGCNRWPALCSFALTTARPDNALGPHVLITSRMDSSGAGRPRRHHQARIPALAELHLSRSAYRRRRVGLGLGPFHGNDLGRMGAGADQN